MRAVVRWGSFLLLTVACAIVSGCETGARVVLLEDEDAAQRAGGSGAAAARPAPMPPEIADLRASPEDARPAAALEDLAAPAAGAGGALPELPTAQPEEPAEGRKGS